MPKIKIIIIDGYTDYDGDWHSQVIEGISDWEEVTEEDYNFIKANLHHLNIKNGTPVIVRQDNISVFERIKGIKATLLKLHKEHQRKQAEAKARREEAAEKRRQKKLEKDKDALKKIMAANPEILAELAVALKE